MKLLKFATDRIPRVLYGVFLLILPFLPLTILFGDINGFRWTMTGYIWILAIAITITFSFFSLAIFGNKFSKLIDKIVIPSNKVLLFLALVALPVILFLISYKIFGHRPLLIDTIVQLFQAEIFLSGHLKAKLPPLPEFFVTQHMLFSGDGWYGQYPPGHSFVLLLGLIFGEPLLFSIILAVLTTGLLYKFAKEIYDDNIAGLSIIIILSSPFFLFMSASYMNHVSTLFLLVSFFYFFAIWEKSNNWIHIFLAGLFLGLTVTIRPLDGIPCALSILVPSIILISKRPYALVVGLLSLAPGILLFLWYNANTTGDAFTPGYLKLWGEGHEMGFHMNPWGVQHTPLIGLRNELVDLQLLNEMLFEWSIPSLFFVAFLMLSKIKLTSWDKRLLALTILCPLAYSAYWHRDSFLGPRFEYCTLIAWIPLTARALSQIKISLESKNIHPLGLFKPVNLGSMFKYSILLSAFYAISLSIPQRAEIYRTSLDSLKVDLKAKAKEQKIDSGIIFIKSSWGVRLFSEMRGLGLSASDSQRAYSFLDHCLLYLTTKDALQKGIKGEEFSRIINAFHDSKPIVQKVKANFDPSLKLEVGRQLDPRCKEELLYDIKNGSQDYTTYEPYMRANTPQLEGPFIFVKDLRDRNSEIMSYYPELKPYIYNGVEIFELDKN